METSNIEELVDAQQRNVKSVVCKHCKCLILKPETAVLSRLEKNLPMITQSNSGQEASEKLDLFWVIDDMYLFENMGFSKTVDDIKYLACAECDVGPIGWHNLSDKKSFVSLHRINHS